MAHCIFPSRHDVMYVPQCLCAMANMTLPCRYDIKIHLSKNSFIHEDIPRLSHILLASDVMTRRPRTLPVRCRVSDIYNLLLETGHNGFPLVSRKDGKLKGEIRKEQFVARTRRLSRRFCEVVS